jgi:hypothetical protein
MSDPRTAPYGSVHLNDLDTLAEVDPGNPGIPFAVSRWEVALPSC